ncbi:hypothetical protein V8E36_003714 [Tilletia maclaganii]
MCPTSRVLAAPALLTAVLSAVRKSTAPSPAAAAAPAAAAPATTGSTAAALTPSVVGGSVGFSSALTIPSSKKAKTQPSKVSSTSPGQPEKKKRAKPQAAEAIGNVAATSADLGGQALTSLSLTSSQAADTSAGGSDVVSGDGDCTIVDVQINAPITPGKTKTAFPQWKNNAFAPGMPSSYTILIDWLKEDNNYERWKGSEGDSQLSLAGDIVQQCSLSSSTSVSAFERLGLSLIR